ncbi:MAG: hypothetical protein R3283_04805 [Balneolaceae bacterium]|nr:hypothetical protein [Balneolaceae bacterium]
MKKITLNQCTLLSILAVLLLTGCGIPSVHPLYEQDDLLVDEKLTGTWESESGESTYAVMSVRDLKQFIEENEEEMALPHEPVVVDNDGRMTEISMNDDISGFLGELEEMGFSNLYLVQQIETPEKVYLAGLVEINNSYYIDFTIVDIGTDVFEFPVHIFLKANLAGDELQFDSFSQEWLMELIRNRQVRISHEMTQFERFLLTAKPRELQKFVEKYGDMEEGFGNSFTYRKISQDAKFKFEELEESGEMIEEDGAETE